MSLEKRQEILSQDSEVCKFYKGKSIFLTGAAGFLGVVVLETLLRCCPGICRIYILLRSKKGIQPEIRKAEIFKKEIFSKLKENYPDSLKKVIAVPGDITEENLGMSEENWKTITQEVSIIFHCAANVSFFKPLSYMMRHNVVGTSNVIDFCRKLKKVEAFVYSSTLYSNSNRETDIDEKIYDLPFKVQEAVELSRNGDEEGLNRLFTMVNPQYPNFYAFSKGVCENLLAENVYDLPVSIIRPSVIICCMKGPMPGFIEYGSALVSLSLGVGRGFLRVARIKRDVNVQLIPADVVANVHIVAAYLQATKSLPSPRIYNCTSGSVVSYTYDEYLKALIEMVRKHPLPKSYLIPSAITCRNVMIYKIYALLYHYVPAFTVDLLLWITGSKFSLVKLYQFYDKCLEKAMPFMIGAWEFKCENFLSLSEKLNETDAEMFSVHLNDFSLEKLTYCLRTGAPIYRPNNKPYKEDISRTLLRYFLTYLLRCAVLGSIASVFFIVRF